MAKTPNNTIYIFQISTNYSLLSFFNSSKSRRYLFANTSVFISSVCAQFIVLPHSAFCGAHIPLATRTLPPQRLGSGTHLACAPA